MIIFLILYILSCSKNFKIIENHILKGNNKNLEQIIEEEKKVVKAILENDINTVDFMMKRCNVKFVSRFLETACESKHLQMVKYFIEHIQEKNIPFVNSYTTETTGPVGNRYTYHVWGGHSMQIIFNLALESNNKEIIKLIIEKYINDNKFFPNLKLKSFLGKAQDEKECKFKVENFDGFKLLNEESANYIIDTFIECIENDKVEYDYFFTDVLIHAGNYRKIPIYVYEKVLERNKKLNQIDLYKLEELLNHLYEKLDLSNFIDLIFEYFTNCNSKEFYKINDFIELKKDFLSPLFANNAFNLIMKQEFSEEFYDLFLKKVSFESFEGFQEAIEDIFEHLMSPFNRSEREKIRKLNLIEILIKKFTDLPENIALNLIAYCIHLENLKLFQLILNFGNTDLNKSFKIIFSTGSYDSNRGKEYSLISYLLYAFSCKYSFNENDLLFTDVLNKKGLLINFKGLLKERLLKFVETAFKANNKDLSYKILSKFLNMESDIKHQDLMIKIIVSFLLDNKYNKNFSKNYNNFYKGEGMALIENKLAIHSLEALAIFKVLHLEKFDDNSKILDLKLNLLNKFSSSKKIDKEYIQSLTKKVREILFGIKDDFKKIRETTYDFQEIENGKWRRGPRRF